MFYVLILLVLIFLGIRFYTYKNIEIPKKETDALIQAVKAEGVPELMPGKVSFVRNGKVTICYEVIQTTDSVRGTVVCVNGYGQNLLGYPPHFYEPLVAEAYRVIRLDNRGMGCTSWMNNWTKKTFYKLEDMAADIIAILDQEGIAQTHIAGFSMGGMIAQTFAINYPNRTLSLISMMSTGYYHDPELVNIPRKFYLDFVLCNLLYGRALKKIDNKLSLSVAAHRLLHGEGYPYEDKAQIQRSYYDSTQRNGFNINSRDQQSYAIIKSGSRYEALKKIVLPTLVIHGTKDPLVPFTHAQKYAPMIPNAKTLFIEGLGHHFPTGHTKTMVHSIIEHLKSVEK